MFIPFTKDLCFQEGKHCFLKFYVILLPQNIEFTFNALFLKNILSSEFVRHYLGFERLAKPIRIEF